MVLRGVQSLSFMLPQSSSSARSAFDGVRGRIRDPHSETIANQAQVAAMN
ncbi:msl5425 [Mesorhizobium japonicum MAFF 303099]|uniref:Msl5425 protein n=1 Tax=Mesorhizobium japonicum (strain LMG 29417 / CECT 9101 / MAFF 303099) TaxID=266835 RepID=Q98BU3_RHILO|nr:msl5425 [Mesorhizobium japonicum MAFF 303099]